MSTAAFSHFGIHVTNLERMVEFYTRVLGLIVTDRGRLDGGPELAFLSRDPDEHHQMVLVTGRPAGAGYNVVNQISFKLPELADLKTMHTRVRAEGIEQFRRRMTDRAARDGRRAGVAHGEAFKLIRET